MFPHTFSTIGALTPPEVRKECAPPAPGSRHLIRLDTLQLVLVHSSSGTGSSRHCLISLLERVQIGRGLAALLDDGGFRRRSGQCLQAIVLVDKGAMLSVTHMCMYKRRRELSPFFNFLVCFKEHVVAHVW